MRKRDEMASPGSCLNRAGDGEWLFVLLGRDRAAVAAVQAWIAERIRIGKNTLEDEQIREAQVWIYEVQKEQAPRCLRCRGCGKIADTDAGEAWSDWLALPLQSAAAVVMGVVKPKTCPTCNGRGSV